MKNYGILFLLILFSIGTKAQNYFITKYEQPQELNAAVRAIIKSKNGFLWAVTYSSLVKYWGGRECLQYNREDGKSMLPHCLLEDRNGVIWVATSDGLFYTSNNVLKKFEFSKSLALKSEKFLRLIEDNKGNIWATGQEGIVCLQRQKDVFLPRLVSTNGNRAYCLYQQPSGSILVGMQGGIFKIVGDTLQSFLTVRKDKKKFDKVFKIFTWYDGNLYFITNFLNKINPNNSYTSVLQFGDYENAAYFNAVYGDKIAVCSFSDTLKVFEKTKLVFATPQEYNKNDWWHVIIDNESNVWAGLGTGLVKISKYNINPFVKVPIKPSSKITMLKPVKDDEMVAGTSGYDFFKINSKTNSIMELSWKKNFSDTFPNIDIGNNFPNNLFFQKSKGRYFILNEGNGLFAINESRRGISNFSVNGKLNYYTYLFFIDNDTSWFFNGGLYKLVDEKMHSISLDGFGGTCYGAFRIKHCDSLFIANNKGLLVYFNGKLSYYKDKSSPFLDNTAILSALKQNDSTALLFVDGIGIYEFSFSKGRLRFSSVLDKTNYKNDFKFCTGIKTQKGDVLVQFYNDPFCHLLQKGVNGYYIKSPIFSEQIKTQFINNSTFEPLGDYVYWLKENTIYRTNISDSNFWRNPQTLKFTNITIKGYTFEHLGAATDYKDNITLSHWQNTVEFNFAQLDFYNSENFTYEYYLEGTNEKEFENNTANNSAIYRALAPGNYTFFVRSLNNYDNAGNLIVLKYSFTILPPWYKTWWAYCFWLLVAIAALWLLFKWRLNIVRKKATVEKLIVDSELKALRAQINPHFIQNTFDLMAQGIYSGKPDEAVGVIRKVSGYLRQVLNKSELSTISLEDELEYTEDYLKMQQMTHSGLFTYRLDIGEAVDTYGIHVPSMLLQPVVENCIKHGFKHKKEGGEIDIRIVSNEKVIIIIVEDNGEGINIGGEMQNHQSKGIEMTRKRIQLMFEKENLNELFVNLTNRGDGKSGSVFTIQFPITKPKKSGRWKK